MNYQIKRFLIISGILLTVIVLFIIGFNNRPAGPGTSQEFSDPSGPAIMNDSEDLFRQVDDSRSFDSIRESLAFYARENIDGYDGPIDVVFTVSESTKQNSEVTMFGNFDKSKDDIRSIIELKNNGKISIQITNLNEGDTVIEGLPNNNIEEQFIGSLPVERTNYFISYSDTDLLYIIEQKSYTDNIVEIVEEDFIENINRTPLRYEEYIILPPPKQIRSPN